MAAAQRSARGPLHPSKPQSVLWDYLDLRLANGHSSGLNRGHQVWGRGLRYSTTAVCQGRPVTAHCAHSTPPAQPPVRSCTDQVLLARPMATLASKRQSCCSHQPSARPAAADTPDGTFAPTLDRCKSAMPVQHRCRISLLLIRRADEAVGASSFSLCKNLLCSHFRGENDEA